MNPLQAHPRGRWSRVPFAPEKPGHFPPAERYFHVKLLAEAAGLALLPLVTAARSRTRLPPQADVARPRGAGENSIRPLPRLLTFKCPRKMHKRLTKTACHFFPAGLPVAQRDFHVTGDRPSRLNSCRGREKRTDFLLLSLLVTPRKRASPAATFLLNSDDREQ